MKKRAEDLVIPFFLPFFAIDYEKGGAQTHVADGLRLYPMHLMRVMPPEGFSFKIELVVFPKIQISASFFGYKSRKEAFFIMFQVQFITHYTETISYLDSARIALEGGCRWIQLRMKDASDGEVETVAREVQSLCRDFGAFFVLDDRVELVKHLHADGVHLGKLDMPVEEARTYLGPEFIIGGTANTFDDVQRLHRAGADYIGCGPFRYTTTKKNLAPILGLEGYRAILSQMEEQAINLPIVGIGGIGADDIADLKATGLNGIALSGSILRAQNPVGEMKRIIELTQK